MYVALVQHAYEAKGGEVQKGKFALGPQFVSPQKTICDTVITHFVFTAEANSYNCSLPLLTYVYLMCSFSVN